MKNFLSSTFIFSIFLFGCCALCAENASPRFRSVCLLKGENGSGSGFFTAIDGRNVVVTNNHVILEIKDVTIRDVNGVEYEYDEVYCSPDRDLAVIPVSRDNLEDMPNFEIHAQVDMLKSGTKAVSYGNSLGADVIVSAQGRYLGVGPKHIEVNVPFVSGNSGGPIVEASTERVIGVATYAMIISAKATTIGSRFQASNFTPAVRRFATRVDKIDLSQFEKTTKALIKKDQEVFIPINEIYEGIHDFLDASRSERKSEFRRLKRLYLNWKPVMQNYEWNTSYLKNECAKRKTIVDYGSDLFLSNEDAIQKKIAEYVNQKELQELWDSSKKSIVFKTKPPVFNHCPCCNGRGRIWVDRDVPQGKLMSAKESKPCPLCEGKSRILASAGRKYAVFSKNFMKKAAALFLPLDAPLFDVVLGQVYSSPADIALHYGSQKGSKASLGVFTVYSYPGNHHYPNALETRFWFFGKVLLRMDMIFPCDGKAPEDSLIEISAELPPLLSAVNPEIAFLRSGSSSRFLIAKKNESRKEDDEYAYGNYGGGGYDSLRKELDSLARDPFCRFASVAQRASADCVGVFFCHPGYYCCMENFSKPR